MPKVGLYNIEGSQIGDMELNASVFEVPVNEAAMHRHLGSPCKQKTGNSVS